MRVHLYREDLNLILAILDVLSFNLSLASQTIENLNKSRRVAAPPFSELAPICRLGDLLKRPIACFEKLLISYVFKHHCEYSFHPRSNSKSFETEEQEHIAACYNLGKIISVDLEWYLKLAKQIDYYWTESQCTSLNPDFKTRKEPIYNAALEEQKVQVKVQNNLRKLRELLDT